MLVRLKISRYLPGHIDPPCFQGFEVELTQSATILEALEAMSLHSSDGARQRHRCPGYTKHHKRQPNRIVVELVILLKGSQQADGQPGNKDQPHYRFTADLMPPLLDVREVSSQATAG